MNNTQPIIIICTSFLVIPLTLTLIRNNNNNDYLIITHSKVMFNFLIKFFPRKKILLFISPKFKKKYFNLINSFKKIKSIIIFKKKIREKLKKFDNSNVYFFFESFAPEMAYSIKYLSKKNNILFMPEMKSKFLYSKTIPSIKPLIHKIFLKIFYGLDTKLVSGQNKKFILLYSDKYFKSINAKKVRILIDYKNLIKFQKKNLKIKNKKILLLCSGESIEQDIINLLKFKKFINQFVSNIDPKNISFKRKNIIDKKYFEENLIEEIPRHLPANMLVYSFKIIIGYHSAVLFEAANKNILSISLLDLLKEKKTEASANHFKNYLIKNLQRNKKIYFPKTFDEFLNLID